MEREGCQDWTDLIVNAPPLYIQERVHPKALIDDLKQQSQNGRDSDEYQIDMFADFNGLPSDEAKTEFYQHDANWSNRMILGDSLQVMASLAEREGLRGKVQCIYIDPPYGIKFNSNFQWSTTSRDVRDGNQKHITREPEQVKAFRDTWRDGIHSYLTYLRDRLTVAHDLLADSGSIFVQIGDENVHRVRALMDELFGDENFVAQITYKVTSGFERRLGPRRVHDYIIWFSKNKGHCKFRRTFEEKTSDEINYSTYRYIESGGLARLMTPTERTNPSLIPTDSRIFMSLPLHTMGNEKREPREFQGQFFSPPANTQWRHTQELFDAISRAGRIVKEGGGIRSKLYLDDFRYKERTTFWTDTGPELSKSYVVQTSSNPISRCILMTTDPGDLVVDPTCGSGTTSYVAEQWGRRWITIDTSRVALALARSRIMGARYPYYLLTDSKDGEAKQAEVERRSPSEAPNYGSVRQGFVYQRVPHITLRDIANNSEIDVIWDEAQEDLEPLRDLLNGVLGESWEEWEIPREVEEEWPDEAKEIHAQWWKRRIARQKEIDASITAHAEYEYLYDKPYEDRNKVRVAGPFTVESISPHRVLGVDERGDIISESSNGYDTEYDFADVILNNLRTTGVQQAHKEDRMEFSSLTPWPGQLVCADGRYQEGDEEDGIERRAAIFIGPEFGTVSRPDLVEAAREAADGGFDVLIACAFNYEAHTTVFESLGRVPVLKARMNADLHMANDLKNTGTGNLFVIFGEPDIEILDVVDDQIRVKVNGVDVFHPSTGEVRSDGPEGIACWFIDTNYNQESFFVRHAYFLGAGDPYKSLKTTLKAEINAEAWNSLKSNISRPFAKPESGRIAVKVINHLGDEVLKVFQVQ